MAGVIIPFTCGSLLSVFFTATHYCIRSKGAKDFLMIMHLFYGGVIFTPTAFLNCIGISSISLNAFCLGTMSPVILTMINKKKHHKKNKKIEKSNNCISP